MGKSIFSIALAQTLAAEGRRVALVDLDLGAANLHTYLGVRGSHPTLADFLTRQVADLSDVLIGTTVPGIQLISGAEYVPGMANIPYATKQKLLRHLRKLPVDVVVLDLGAGVAFNTLDFFAVAQHGVVVTAPEPAAVMNAYGFIKSALFRRLQHVFKRHDVLGPLIEAQASRRDDERELTLDWLRHQVQTLAPDEAPLLAEISSSFRPHLVVNRADDDREAHVIHNLVTLCRNQLGVSLHHQCVLPELPGMRKHALDIPSLLKGEAGIPFMRHVTRWLDIVLTPEPLDIEGIRQEFSDAEIARLQDLLDGLDDFTFVGTSRKSWKLRLYFKPTEVVEFLLRRGVKEPEFLELAVA